MCNQMTGTSCEISDADASSIPALLFSYTRGRKEVEREERRRQKDGRREYRACIADTKKWWKTVISNSLGYSSI